MFELTVERQFSAAHYLDDYSGPCSRLHGHNYRVLVSFRGRHLDPAGFVVDFATLKGLCDQALAPLDHQYLNEVPALANRNPTAEAVAHYLHQEVARLAANLPVKVSAVTVYESDTTAVTYREE
jgi:6-pyruvoyltetrahydropterin/6-carboxytetrahydropterin synthase